MTSQPATRNQVFDWVDVLLGYVTLCGAFGVAALMDVPSGTRWFKYGVAAVLLVVLALRRVFIGSPRVVAVGQRRSVLGVVGAACMMFGLAISTLGGALLFAEYGKPVSEPFQLDRDGAEKTMGVLALGPGCTRDGKVTYGRACMTPEERAAEAARDEQEYAVERAKLQAEKDSRLAVYWGFIAVGTLLVGAGIALDITRSRRDAVPA